MAKPDVKFVEYQGRLVVRVRGPYGRKDQGKRVWVARIVGLHDEFTFEREFLGDRREVTVTQAAESWTETHAIVELEDLKDGDLLQVSNGRWNRGWFRYRVAIDNPVEQMPPLLEPLDDDRFKQLLGLKLGRPTQLPHVILKDAARKFRIEEDDNE